jgi:hypothetical protein
MRRLNAFFRNNTDLAQLSEKAQQLTACQKLWDAVVPETFKPYTQAGDISHKRLTVYASNGAVAAKVKLLLPSLLTNLQKHGLEVTSIRVQVQVQSSPPKPTKVSRKLSPFAASKIEKLAMQLDDNPALALMLRKLSSRSNDN